MTAQKPVAEEQKREALEKLLHSRALARADQLRRFLRYVCEAEMAGRAGEITEHRIAIEALGRTAHYVHGDDSSVRNRAHALRQKLAEYYRLEDPRAPVQIELRKGSYVPVYVQAAAVAAEAAPSAPAAKEAAAEPCARRRWLVPFLAGFAVAALAAA